MNQSMRICLAATLALSFATPTLPVANALEETQSKSNIATGKRDAINRLLNASIEERKNRNYSTAAVIYLEALKIAQSTGSYSPQLMTVLEEGALLATDNKKSALAEDTYQKLIALEQLNNPASINIGRYHNALGSSYFYYTKDKEAIAQFEEAKRFLEANNFTNTNEYATALFNLGELSLKEQKLVEAEKLLRQAKLLKTSLNKGVPTTSYFRQKAFQYKVFSAQARFCNRAYQVLRPFVENSSLSLSASESSRRAWEAIKKPDFLLAVSALKELQKSSSCRSSTTSADKTLLDFNLRWLILECTAESGSFKNVKAEMLHLIDEASKDNSVPRADYANLLESYSALASRYDARTDIVPLLLQVEKLRTETYGLNDPLVAQTQTQIGLTFESLDSRNHAYLMKAADTWANFSSELYTPLNKQQNLPPEKLDGPAIEGRKAILRDGPRLSDAASLYARQIACLMYGFAAIDYTDLAKTSGRFGYNFVTDSTLLSPYLQLRMRKEYAQFMIDISAYSVATDILLDSITLAEQTNLEADKVECLAMLSRTLADKQDMPGAWRKAVQAKELADKSNFNATAKQTYAAACDALFEAAMSLDNLPVANKTWQDMDAATFDSKDEFLGGKKLLNLSELLLRIGKGNETIDILDDVLKRWDKFSDINLLYYKGKVYLQLGKIYLANNTPQDKAKAVQFLQKALDIHRNDISSKSIACVFEETERLIRMLVTKLDKEKFPNKFGTLLENDYSDANLSRFINDQKNTTAKEQLQELINLRSSLLQKRLDQDFITLTLAEQLELNRLAKNHIGMMLTLAEANYVSPAEIYSQLYKWKGMVLGNINLRNKYIDRNKHRELIGEIQSINQNLTRLRAPTLTATISVEKLYDLIEAKERKERDVLLGAMIVNALDPISIASFKTVQNKIAEKDSVFIDIFQYSWNDKSSYAAFLLVSNNVSMVPLGDAEVLDEALSTWLTSASTKPLHQSAEILASVTTKGDGSRTLSSDETPDTMTPMRSVADLEKPRREALQKLLNPLMVHETLRNAKRVVIAPDGQLSKLPWDLFVADNLRGNYALVTSIRELYSAKRLREEELNKGSAQTNQTNTKMLVVGGIDYKKAEELPGAKEEVKELLKILPADKFNVTQLFGANATVQNLLKDATNSQYVLISTHGYFVDSRKPPPVTIKSDIDRTLANDLMARIPLCNSGLVFASDSFSGPNADAYASAEELLQLSLRQTKLVTLSACRTGLGATETGQGVIGLQSAILGSGARALIMSMWKVDDEATRELMKSFHTNHFLNNRPIAESLKLAQEHVQQHKPEWKAPYYWAAWVPAGEIFD
ncbi:CHAT domain-containing protein [Candidatus Obscuribacterales bacterium]|nr:CHAT domain-containing protein [Candidatus Obscuribacterales bacterium]